MSTELTHKPHLSDIERDDLELTEMPLIFDFHIYFAIYIAQY